MLLGTGYIRGELLSTRKKTAFWSYSFCPNEQKLSGDKEIWVNQIQKVTQMDMWIQSTQTGFARVITLAARGLEEPRNSQELLIESVGPVSLFCVLCHIVPICCFSMVLKYITYALTYACRNIHLWTILYIIVS